MVIHSTITCPECGYKKEATMPTDMCVIRYECEQCGAVLRPKEGDCCVFCSFGTAKCPPVQSEK
ncbi:MAG: GDCCVxC domain-containing (seleno)protein [Fimbriimonadaceae bacterium]